MRQLKATEEQEQMALVEWINLLTIEGIRMGDYLHHSPNGGKRSKSEGSRFKKMGTKAGFPDLFLALPVIKNKSIHRAGLFIEMKSRNGKVSKKQKSFIDNLRAVGYETAICYGYEDAKKAVMEYFKNSNLWSPAYYFLTPLYSKEVD